MPRTISDAEDNFYKGRAQVADFAESLWNDPTVNKDLKRLVKKKHPHIQIPDLDIEDRVEARLAEDRRQRDEAEAARQRAAEDQQWAQERARTQKEFGFTDEGMADLEKFMIEKKIGDYGVAATYKVNKDPKPIEPQSDSFRWAHEKQPEFAEISKDPEGWGRAEILKAIHADQARERGGR